MKSTLGFCLFSFALIFISCKKNVDNNIAGKWELSTITLNGQTEDAKSKLGYTKTITIFKDSTFEKERRGNMTDAIAKGTYTSRIEKVTQWVFLIIELLF